MQLPTDITSVVAMALKEDIGSGDLSADLVSGQASASVICREAAVICGQAWFNEVFHQLDPAIQIHWQVQEAAQVTGGTQLCRLNGPAATLLSGERCALNFLQTLSGTATAVRAYVDAMAGSHTRLLDTRKTLPCLRSAQKYAVRCGGGHNHRMGLYDGILLKENHIAALGSVQQAVQLARQRFPDQLLEIEVENLQQLQAAKESKADRALLDNMNVTQLRQCVDLAAGKIELEASGGVTLDTIGEIAKTGVDFISVGDMTKNLRAIDLSMRFDSD